MSRPRKFATGTRSIGAQIEADKADRLAHACRTRGTTVSDTVRELIDGYLAACEADQRPLPHQELPNAV